MSYERLISSVIKNDEKSIPSGDAIRKRLLYSMGLKALTHQRMYRNSFFSGDFLSWIAPTTLATKLAAVFVVAILAINLNQQPIKRGSTLPVDTAGLNNQLADTLFHPKNILWTDSIIQ